MLSTPDAGLWVGGVAALRAALARWRRGQALILVYEAKSMGLKSRVRSPHNNRKYRRHFARREEHLRSMWSMPWIVDVPIWRVVHRSRDTVYAREAYGTVR